ncbi:hypothetical protein VTN96DRAFT_131 [Rasamsonia emersonii]
MAAMVSTRRNRGSEIELCYASPVTTTGAILPPPPSPAPSAAWTRDGRKRKTRSSSDDSGEQLLDEKISGQEVRTYSRAFEPLRYSPVLPTDLIYPIWNNVLDRILSEVDLTEIKGVECFRLGKNEDPKENPPTVILTVARGSTKDWRPVQWRFHTAARLRNWDNPNTKIKDVYKAGRSTGYTAGEYFDLKTASIATAYEDGKLKTKVTIEHCITRRHGKPFSLPPIYQTNSQLT